MQPCSKGFWRVSTSSSASMLCTMGGPMHICRLAAAHGLTWGVGSNAVWRAQSQALWKVCTSSSESTLCTRASMPDMPTTMVQVSNESVGAAEGSQTTRSFHVCSLAGDGWEGCIEHSQVSCTASAATCCRQVLARCIAADCSPSMLSTAMSPAAKPLSARLLLLWLGPDAGGMCRRKVYSWPCLGWGAHSTRERAARQRPASSRTLPAWRCRGYR